MQHAFAVLRLAPDHFWRMTPREFAAALPLRRRSPMPRDVLQTLMATYPDQVGGNDGSKSTGRP